jgi:hypothetical protein
MEARRSAAVFEVLAAERPRAQCPGVANSSAGEVDDAMASVEPSITEVSVLGGPKGRIEAADLSEAAGSKGQIVGSEETRAGGIGIVVSVHDLNDELAGDGAEAPGHGVDRRSAHHALWLRRKELSQLLQPAWLGQAVVIREREKFCPCALRTGVPGGRRPGIPLLHEGYGELRVECRDGCMQRRVTPIVDYNDLEAVARVVQLTHRLKAVKQQPRA